MALQRVVLAPVFELFPNATADLETEVRGDGHIPRVEKTVNVPAKQDPIARIMAAAFGIRPYMCGVEGRQGALTGHGASTVIKIGYEYPERPLTQTGRHQDWIAVPRKALAIGRSTDCG